MKPEEIKLKRTESVLKELIPEALSTLTDERFNMVDVVDVKCSKGRDDAKVYIDPHDFNEHERTAILKQLKKAAPIIEEYCLQEQGWYRTPKLAFIFDEQFEKSKRIEALFDQISKERNSGS